jgi:hypothetical protein
MDSPTVPQDTPNELADDILRGGDQIAEFIFGERGSRRKVYYLAECSRLNDGGCATLFETWQSHTVRFSFISVVMKSQNLTRPKTQGAARRGFLICASSDRSWV